MKLDNLGIRQANEMLSSKKISAKELAQHYLKVIEEKNKDLNAFLSYDPEQVLSQAQRAQSKIDDKQILPLTAIPIAIKDNILVKGAPATAASQILKHFIAPYDSHVSSKLKECDAVILGKTNCDEFAMGSSNENSSFGSVKNPHNHSKVPGGSSGGSACAVAADMCLGALGTDTGGSVRQPAAFCGVVGLKPTYGRISRRGIIAFGSSLDQVGPLAKTVEDCAYLYDAISGHDPKDSTSANLNQHSVSPSLKTFTSLKGVKVGYSENFLPGEMDPVVKEHFLKTVKKIESLGAKVIEIDLPHANHGVSCYYVLAPAEASSNLARFDGVHFSTQSQNVINLKEAYERSRTEGFGPEVKRRILIGTFVLSSGYYDAYYTKALKVRTLIKQDFTNAFEHVDLIVTPTTPTGAFDLGQKSHSPLEMYLADVFTVPVSIAGVPALSLPSGRTPDHMPLGLQIIAKPFDEERLLKCAYVMEQDLQFLKG